MSEKVSGLVQAGKRGLPPVLAGHLTPEVRARVEGFYSSVAGIFATWVNRRQSVHT